MFQTKNVEALLPPIESCNLETKSSAFKFRQLRDSIITRNHLEDTTKIQTISEATKLKSKQEVPRCHLS